MDLPHSLTTDERQRALDVIAAEVSSCTRCPLSQTRTMAVPGEGSSETEVVFVGEGPGYNEDQAGRPFVGAAGGLLNELLKAIGWKREEVFITNVVKCRPPGNRDPEPYEIEACAPYLQRQLEVLDPGVVVTLGRHSLGTFMPGARITGTHGTARPVDPATGAADATAYAMYHPAAALRQYSLRRTMLEDMCNLPGVLTSARERRATTREPRPEMVAVAVAPEPTYDAVPAATDAIAAPDVPLAAAEESLDADELAVAIHGQPGAAHGADEPQLGLFG